MGMKSRRKGRAFEQLIVRKLKEEFPHLADSLRRGKQSHLADECDATGIPGVWFELEHADNPHPDRKLEQAKRDAHETDIPIAVTHKTGARSIKATLSLSNLVKLWLLATESPAAGAPVSIDFDALLRLLKVAHPKMQGDCDAEEAA